MSKKVKIIIVLVLLLAVIGTISIIIASRVKIKDYSNSNFKVSYDTTWKVKNSGEELYLVHKKTKSELKIQCKVLDSNYIDTSLSDLIDDIIYSIEEQNSDYKLINRSENVSQKYDSYAYLYEKDDEQVSVTILKKDAKLLFISYEADTKYFDILLPSVDDVLRSIEFVFD